RRADADDPVKATLRFVDPANIPTPGRLGIDVPPAVDAVFVRALSIEPQARQADAAAFWRALLEASAPARRPAEPPPAPAPRRWALLVAAVAAAAAALWWLLAR